MAYLEELLPEFRKGAKIRCDYWDNEKSKTLKFLTNVHIEAEYRFNGF